MIDTLRPWIARTAGVVVSGLAGWLLVHYSIAIPADARALLTDVVGAVMLMLATYAATHTGVSKVVNPVDAASTGAAKEGKREQRARKFAREAVKESDRTRLNMWHPPEDPEPDQ